MDDKLIYIHNNNKQEYPSCRLKLLFGNWTLANQNSVKVPKVSEPTNKINWK